MPTGMTAEQAAAARAAAQQNQAQQTGQPVNWNGNAPVGGPPGGGGTDNYGGRQNPNNPHRGGPGKGGASQPGGANTQWIPGQGWWQGPQAPPPPPFSSQMPGQGRDNPFMPPSAPFSSQLPGQGRDSAGPVAPAMPGMGAGYQSMLLQRQDQAFNAGVPQDQVPLYLSAGFGGVNHGAGITQLGGPGAPPPPDAGGGGGHGGRGRGGGGAPADVPPETLSQILTEMAHAVPGANFDLPPRLQQELAQNGRGPVFRNILMALGFVPGSFVGQYGFETSWTVPGQFNVTPDIMGLLGSLMPEDKSALMEIMSTIFGVDLSGASAASAPLAPTGGVPPVPQPKPFNPVQPGPGGFGDQMPIAPPMQ